MAKIDKEYHRLLQDILDNGTWYEDPNRKGVKRLQIPHYTFEHSFEDGFPAVTTKKLYWKGVVGELLWILRGDTNIKYLVDNGINIWNKDAYNWFSEKCNQMNQLPISYIYFLKRIKEGSLIDGRKHFEDYKLGDCGRIYGAQFRNWDIGGYHIYTDDGEWERLEGIDQLSNLIHTLRTNPMATKKTVTFWNPSEINDCALSQCHWSFEILVEPLNRADILRYKLYKLGEGREVIFPKERKYKFTLKWHQHSVDTFLGLPFNIASYALLAQMIGRIVNMVPKGIIGDLSNVHIYDNAMDAVKEQLSRDVDRYGRCELDLEPIRTMKMGMHNNIDNWLSAHDIEDFNLLGYESYPNIKVEMLPYNKG